MAFEYGGITVLSHPIFVEVILPFLLIFTIIFAVLQKSKILGESKKQIDAIVALVVALLAISFGQAIGIILQLIPFLAVSLVIILVLMLLLGMFNKQGDWDATFPKRLRTVLMFVAIIALVVTVLLITGSWNFIYDYIFFEGGDSNIFINIVFVIVIVTAVAGVIWGSKDNTSSPSSN